MTKEDIKKLLVETEGLKPECLIININSNNTNSNNNNNDSKVICRLLSLLEEKDRQIKKLMEIIDRNTKS